MNHINLSKATVIIPAHNRPQKLKRLLEYYSKTNINIIVSDSSDIRFSFSSDYPNCKYFHFPRMTFLEKINAILPFIQTPFVLFCADDDFITSNGISSCIEFLEKNPTYACAQGHFLSFEYNDRRIKFNPIYIQDIYAQIVAESIQERIHFYNTQYHYASFLYSVTRTENFKKIYTSCFSSKKLLFSELYLAELYFLYGNLCFGNYSTLPIFYGIREKIKGSATTSCPNLTEIASSSSFLNEINGFKTSLNEIMNNSSIDDSIDWEAFFKKSVCKSTWKTQITMFVAKNKALRWLSPIFDKRYEIKGRKRLKGVKSFPFCTITRKEKNFYNEEIRQLSKHIFSEYDEKRI